jgi:transcription factor WhiB
MTRRNAARRQAATATALAAPGRWAERALCAQADPDTWLREKDRRALAAVALRTCGDCPVRAQCLDYALSGADTWGRDRDWHLGRRHTTGARPTPAAAQTGGGMTSAARPRRRRQHAMAARQALRLFEAALPQRTERIRSGRHRVPTVTPRAALRAAGVPPLAAAALRRRLRLIPEQEAER